MSLYHFHIDVGRNTRLTQPAADDAAVKRSLSIVTISPFSPVSAAGARLQRISLASCLFYNSVPRYSFFYQNLGLYVRPLYLFTVHFALFF